MKRIGTLLTALVLSLLLLPGLTDIAHAGDLDYIDRYDVTVTPDPDDGSLRIRVELRWTVLEDGPVDHLQIGIPNGSIRETEALSSNIASLDFDNSYMYVYFTQGYDTGETFDFAYAWTQEYMYTLDESGGVQYDYTPGWFDEAEIGQMSVTWMTPAELQPIAINGDGSGTEVETDYGAESTTFVSHNLSHGAQIHLWVGYDSWPGELFWEQSSENLPQEEYYGDDYYEDDAMEEQAIRIAVRIIILVVILVLIFGSRGDGYAGGFGTRYVFFNGLWYPQGADGRPRPGSTGTRHKPKPPRSGMGGGDRGGGFGGSGFGGGGGHCACASSCACACACACAGGGRAGCSAKNLYGAVKLSRELAEELEK